MSEPSRAHPPSFGEFAPFFTAATDTNPRYAFSSVGGRWIVLAFLGSLATEPARIALDAVMARRRLFDDENAAMFGVSVDPDDRQVRGLRASSPGVRFFWDFDRQVSQLYGVVRDDVVQPLALLLDHRFRVVAAEPLERMDVLLDRLQHHLIVEQPQFADQSAPVLTVPRVFTTDLCKRLIAYYEQAGGRVSGFMRQVDGKTHAMLDASHKRRKDAIIEDQDLAREAQRSLRFRLLPSIERTFNWRALYVERNLVACYSAEDEGFFGAHRDNTTSGTAHRVFAVSINLNTDYEGGELRFPEFGRRTYKPPKGGAVVFSCSLLHEATPVTKGVRYAYLPFLYDEEGRRKRDDAQHLVVRPADPAPSQQAEPEPVAS